MAKFEGKSWPSLNEKSWPSLMEYHGQISRKIMAKFE
jgi:hypothetical protein